MLWFEECIVLISLVKHFGQGQIILPDILPLARANTYCILQHMVEYINARWWYVDICDRGVFEIAAQAKPVQ